MSGIWGFNHESLVADVGLEYYSISFSPSRVCRAEEPLHEASPQPDDGQRDPQLDLDLLRVRTKEDSRTGTLRTRDGSGDKNIPANKVMLIFDEHSGKYHCLIKADDVPTMVTILEESTDPTPKDQRPVRVMRGSTGRPLVGRTSSTIFLPREWVTVSVPVKLTQNTL